MTAQQPRDSDGKFGEVARDERPFVVFTNKTDASFADAGALLGISDLDELTEYCANLDVTEEEEAAGHWAAMLIWGEVQRRARWEGEFERLNGPCPEITPESKLPGAAKNAHNASKKAAEEYQAAKKKYVEENKWSEEQPPKMHIRLIMRLGVLQIALSNFPDAEARRVNDSPLGGGYTIGEFSKNMRAAQVAEMALTHLAERRARKWIDEDDRKTYLEHLEANTRSLGA